MNVHKQILILSHKTVCPRKDIIPVIQNFQINSQVFFNFMYLFVNIWEKIVEDHKSSLNSQTLKIHF